MVKLHLAFALSGLFSLAAALNPGMYRIRSLSQADKFLGVTPARLAIQPVRAEGIINEWRVTGVGQNNFKLSINGYPYTRVDGNYVVAAVFESVESTWEIVSQNGGNIYSIKAAGRPEAWTVENGNDLVSAEPLGSVNPEFQHFEFIPFQ